MFQFHEHEVEHCTVLVRKVDDEHFTSLTIQKKKVLAAPRDLTQLE